VPEENFWTLWCKGRPTEADTLTIWLGATPSRLTSAHLHHPPFFTRQMPFLSPNQQCQSTKGNKIRQYMYRMWWLSSLVAKALDLQLAGCEFNSQPWRCRVTTLDKLFTPTCLSRSQWFSDGMIDCGVRGRGQYMFITTATVMYSLGHGLCTLPAVPRSTQPSTLRGMVK